MAADCAGVRQIRRGFRTQKAGVYRWCSLGASLLVLQFVLDGCAGVLSSPGGSTQPGSLQVNPQSVSFGKVGVGKQSSQNISFRNPGKNSISITQVTSSNPQFVLSGMTPPLNVPAGQAASFSISVKPTTIGSLSGTLSVVSDSSPTPQVLNLSATGVTAQPQISLGSSMVDFGSVGVGTQSTENLIVSNAGGSDLTISLLTLTGAEFAVNGITTPKIISTGQTAIFTFTFLPTAAGSANGGLAITSNDPTNPTVNISLTGSGTNSPVGQLTANPTSVEFGDVNTRSSASKQIVLTNTGNTAVKISQISASGSGFNVTGVAVPSTVKASQSLTLTVAFAPTTVASASGTVMVTSDAKGSPFAIPLTGTGVQPGLNVSPASFDFGSFVDGQTKSQGFRVTNTGSASLTIAQISVSGAGFTVSGLATPSTLAAGQSASFSAGFAPRTAGTVSGAVSISSNAPNSPTKVALSGTGLAASVSLTSSPASLAFGNVNAGTSSAKSVTLTNSGNASVTISQVAVSAKDVITSGITTPLTLTPGQAKTMNVVFGPTTAENVTGNITVTSAQGSSSVIAISGTGVQAALGLTPATVSFGNVPVASAISQTVQVRNSGTALLMISQVSAAGSGFSTSGLSLPLSLNPGATTTFNVQYLPTSAGATAGSVSLASNAPNSPATLPLSGTGITATKSLSFSPTSLNFGNVTTGGVSSEGVVITNTGNSNVLISQINASGTGFGVSGAGTPVTLTPGQTLTTSINFSPASAGVSSGSVSVTSNALGSPAKITLAGTGVQPSAQTVLLSWNASTSSVSGYNVYRSTTSGTGYARLNSSPVATPTYTDSALQSATTYYYVTTAVDASGNESANSNEAKAVIP
jgi:Abnormal spindle-like microcephaly-assoc'd, ASPM-SPD-2-Hydin/Protein of unknown function (DUF1573)